MCDAVPQKSVQDWAGYRYKYCIPGPPSTHHDRWLERGRHSQSCAAPTKYNTVFLLPAARDSSHMVPPPSTPPGGDPKTPNGSPLVVAGSLHQIPATATGSARSHKIELQTPQDANSPIPQVTLRKLRFVLAAALGVAVTGAGLACFLPGLTIETRVQDRVGVSTNADSRVEHFQSINGFVWAAVGLLLEQYFKIFMAVMLIFFANRKWHPRDLVTEGPTKFKRTTLFWFTPLIMYVINIGLSSVFIEHKLDELARAFVDEDLVSQDMLTASTLSSTSASATSSNSVLDTVLRSAVMNQAVPFQIKADLSCAVSNADSQTSTKRTVILPKLPDLQSTSVTFGFPARMWNLDAMPFALAPTHVVNMTHATKDSAETEAQMEAFLQSTGNSFATLADLMIQGATLHGRALSNSNVYFDYDCTLPEGTVPSRRLASQSSSSGSFNTDVGVDVGDDKSETETETEAPPTSTGQKTRCYGARDALVNTVSLRQPPTAATNSTATMASQLMDALPFVERFATDQVSIQLEQFQLSPLIKVTTLTIDLPYANTTYIGQNRNYCNPNTYKFSNSTQMELRYPDPQEYAQAQEELCSGNVLSILDPYQKCGQTNCVIEDLTYVLTAQKEILMTPFLANCDPTTRAYDTTLIAWFPDEKTCTRQENAAFLYGMGTYFSGEVEIQSRGDRGPYIRNPNRHVVLTFAKMDWKFENVSKRFDAKCTDVNGCMGMVHGLQNMANPASAATEVTKAKANAKPRVLLVGQQQVPSGFLNSSLKNPVPLVVLRDPQIFGVAQNKYTTYYNYEYLDLATLNVTYSGDPNRKYTPGDESPLNLAQDQCSLYMDGYLTHVETNHYYMRNPVQPLYTSALYYLFQDGSVKELTSLPEGSTAVDQLLSQPFIGKARMNGDRETIEIRYSIPLPSVVSTALGIVMLLVYMGVILHWPREAVKLTDEQNAAAKFADVLVEDLYPQRVHTRRLKLQDGTVVEMDAYAAQRIVFHHVDAPEMPVVME